MNFDMWASIFIAGAASLVSPFFLRKLLIRNGVLDVPNARSSHDQPTLRGGGIAALVGFILAAIWLTLTSIHEADDKIFFILYMSIFVGIVGLVEDLRGLQIIARAGFQLLAGAIIGVFLWYEFNVPLLMVPIIAFIFAFQVNLTNFMDGINGISGLHGFVVGLIFALTGVAYSLAWLTITGLIISIAFLTFLPWNLSRPGMFLGDVGSYLLGASIGSTALIALADGIHPLFILAAVGIYWADTSFTLSRRLLAREPVFEAHRSHVYQKLTDSGLTHLQTAVVVAFLTLLLAVIAWLAISTYISMWFGVALILGIIVLYLLLPKMRGV